MIIVTEIPYQVNKAIAIVKIAELVNEKKINDLDLRDESDRKGLWIYIELKRGVQEAIILNQRLSIHSSKHHLVLILWRL